MKEDTIITSEEWLERGKWTKFLMSLPLGKSRTFKFVGEYKLQLIRITAAGLSNDNKCDRRFSIVVDANREYFTITTSTKKDDKENPYSAAD